MQLNKHLVPISFHLRNFNKYPRLDLQASQMGNMTLIGENAVGKTTLANCFFPMLVDGSIATPSFNPAQDTKRLNHQARNSAQDDRNFDSMLLGWGVGAMKVRTGYSYLRLASTQRQVILGLGATRTTGSPRKPTWWFLVVSQDPQQPLELQTTDDQGWSLDKVAFKAQNAGLGATLQVFDHANEYRDQVATQVYGFDNGQRLSQLTATYRLLASPILTGGNAEFTPIVKALRDAQEGIDAQTIRQIADSQCEVNYTNALLKRLAIVHKRLTKLKHEIFWGNLNRLQELTLKTFAETRQLQAKKKIDRDSAQQVVMDCEQQLNQLQPQLKAVKAQLSQLQEKLAAQRVLETTRQQLQTEIDHLKQQLQQYQSQLQRLEALRQQAATIAEQLAANQTAQTTLKNTKIRPIHAQLDRYAGDLAELRQVLMELDLTVLSEQLRRYIGQQTLMQTKHQGLQQQITQGNLDVQIVGRMKTEMGSQISTRLSNRHSRVRDELQQDNQEIHDQGASDMDQHVKALIEQQQELEAQHPDLRPLLDQPQILAELKQHQRQLQGVLQEQTQLIQQQQRLLDQQRSLTQQITPLEQVVAAFDEPATHQRMAKSQQRRAALQIDPQLPSMVQQTAAKQDQYEKTIQALLLKQGQGNTQVKLVTQEIAIAQDQLDQLTTQTEQALQTLRPYMPTDSIMTDVDAVLAFTHQHQSQVKAHNYAGIVDQISRGIHHNGADGTDINAIDTTFEERGHSKEASQMRQQRTVSENGLTVVAFDINQALTLVTADQEHVQRKMTQLEKGNDVAHMAYLNAAVDRISRQYRLIDEYNELLEAGNQQVQQIKLKIDLTPKDVSAEVIAEAQDALLEERPRLLAEIRLRLNWLANDSDLATDETAFYAMAQEKLDTRNWSEFQVLIKRRQSQNDQYEVVDNKFVKSGGSGAEKAQAMVLPLLLVPKMILQQAKHPDTPYLVMFDEFADKLDPETAKAFARTITNFGFNFIATMPSGAQNKILADGVANVVYDVIAPTVTDDGKFHPNHVRPALIWQKEAPYESLS